MIHCSDTSIPLRWPLNGGSTVTAEYPAKSNLLLKRVQEIISLTLWEVVNTRGGKNTETTSMKQNLLIIIVRNY